MGLAESIEDLEASFKAGDVSPDCPRWLHTDNGEVSPYCILAYEQHIDDPYIRCDDGDAFTGQVKDANQARGTYSTAQKMRAAVSSRFSRDYNRGVAPWTRTPYCQGSFSGNPSQSNCVSQYMISLVAGRLGRGNKWSAPKQWMKVSCKSSSNITCHLPIIQRPSSFHSLAKGTGEGAASLGWVLPAMHADCIVHHCFPLPPPI